jgi:hypothetical protein
MGQTRGRGDPDEKALASTAVAESRRTAATWPVPAGLAGGVVLVLLSVAGRYGYHRDELYFLRAGRESALGYVTQPPLSPPHAHAAGTLFGGSPVGLRLPSALAAGLTVLCIGRRAAPASASRGTPSSPTRTALLGAALL